MLLLACDILLTVTALGNYDCAQVELLRFLRSLIIYSATVLVYSHNDGNINSLLTTYKMPSILGLGCTNSDRRDINTYCFALFATYGNIPAFRLAYEHHTLIAGNNGGISNGIRHLTI
jgi:hypothetical protein